MPSTVQKYIVGTRCRSQVWDLFEGKIIHVPDTKDDFYKVRYTDGDEEEYDLDEIHKCRNYFLEYKKKASESKKKKYNMGTKVANYFPNGESVDGQIVAVNKNNYRVKYDDDTEETINKEKMMEQVKAYKQAYPEYEIPTVKTPSKSASGKGKATASNQKKAKAKADSNKSKQVVAKEAEASSKPVAQDESESSKKPSNRMSPRRAKASTSKGLSPKKAKATAPSSKKSPKKAKAASTREKTTSTTQEIAKVSVANIEGKDLFDDEKSENLDSNAKEQSISKADEGISRVSAEDKTEKIAGEEEEQAETNTKDQITTKGPQHLDVAEGQASDLQVSNESKKSGQLSVLDTMHKKIGRFLWRTGGNARKNGVEMLAESVSPGTEEASVENIDQQEKGKGLSVGGDEIVEKAPQDPTANSKSDQIPRRQDVATSRKKSENPSKESEKEPSNVSQTANMMGTSSTNSSRRNEDAGSGMNKTSSTNSSKSSLPRVPKKSAKSTAAGRKPPLATTNSKKSSKRKLPSSSSPQDSIEKPFDKKKGENRDESISKKRPRPNSPLTTAQHSRDIPVESPGKKDAMEAFFILKSGKYLNHESGNKGEKDVSKNPVTEGSGNSKEVNNNSIDEEEKLRLRREQGRKDALEFLKTNKGDEANPILIADDDDDDDDDIEVLPNPNIEKLSNTKIDARSKKTKQDKQTEKNSKKTEDPPSSPPKLKNRIGDSDKAIHSAQKAMKLGETLISDSEMQLSPKPRNGKSPLKKRILSSNVSQEPNHTADQNHTKKKASARNDAISTSNPSQASPQAANARHKHSQTKKKSPTKKDEISTSLDDQASLQGTKSRSAQSHTKDKSAAKKAAKSTSNPNQASPQADNARNKHSQTKKKSPTKNDEMSTSNPSQPSLLAATSTKGQNHAKKKTPAKMAAKSTSNPSQASLQVANARNIHTSQLKKKAPAKKDTIPTSDPGEELLQPANPTADQNHVKKKAPAKKDTMSTSNASQELLQEAESDSRSDQSHGKKQISAEKISLDSISGKQTKKNKNESDHSKDDLTSTNRVPLVRMPGKELVTSKKRRRPPEAFDQTSQRKQRRMVLPTAKNRDVSNSPKTSKESGNLNETKVAATGEKAGQKKVVSSGSSSSDDMSVSSEEESTEINGGEGKDKDICIAPIQQKEKRIDNLNMSSKEYTGLRKNASALESEKVGETSINSSCAKADNLLVMEGSVQTSNAEKGLDDCDRQSLKPPQSVKATSKSIDKGIHLRQQSAQPLSQVEKMSKVAIETQSVKATSKSIDKGIHLRQQSAQPLSQVEKVSKVAIETQSVNETSKSIDNGIHSRQQSAQPLSQVEKVSKVAIETQSVNETSKSIDNGIHSRQQNAQPLSQVEKVSKVAIETQSVNETSKSIDNGIHSRQQNNQCSSQKENVSKVAIEAEDNASKSNPKDTVGLVNRNPKLAQEFLQTQPNPGTKSAFPEKGDRSSTSKDDNRKVKETRPIDSILEGPSPPGVEDKDPLPSANFLAQRFGKTSSVNNSSLKSTSSSSSGKSSGSLVDTSEKADDTIALSSSTLTSHPPTVANEKVGKQATSQESISKTSATSTTSTDVSFQKKAALFKQPKGRPPKGKRWDNVNGVWVPVARNPNLPSKVANSPKESSKLPNKGADSPKKSSDVQNKDTGSSKKASKLPNKEPRFFPKPQGRPRLNCTWDSSNGLWIPNNGDQQMSNKQKSKITFRESLEIKVILNGECVNSVPKMKYYGSWPDAKSSGRIRKASEDSNSGVFKRPRGRARLGMSWNSRLGKWVPDGSKKPTPPTATSPFKDKMDYLRTMDSNNRGRLTRSEYTFEQNIARALHESRVHELKKLYLPKQKTSNEDNGSGNLKRDGENSDSVNLKKDEENSDSGNLKRSEENNGSGTLERGEENNDSGNLKRGEENSDSGNLKRGEENSDSGNLKRGEEKNGKGDNVNSSAVSEEELDEIINTNGGTDHELNALLNQAHSSPTKKTNMFGDTSLDGMGESISFANSNHGITTPTIDQLLLNASPLNNHRMSLPFSIEELNRDMERNHDLHHPSTRNSSSSGINRESLSNSAQREIPPSREQNMDTEGLTSPVIRLLGEVQTPSPYRNPQAEARMAVANQLIHLRHSPILTSREQSPQNNTATTRKVDGQIPNFDSSLFSGSAIKPPSRPSSAPPALNPPRPSSAPPAIDTARHSFTRANYGRTFSTAVQNNVVPQRLSLGASQQQSSTRESLPRVETGIQVTTAATNSASTRTAFIIQRQDRVPMERHQAPPVNRNPTALINQPQPPIAEVQIPANQAEPQPEFQERDDELEEVSIGDEEEQRPPVVQDAEEPPREERNNEPEEAPIQARNNQDEAAQDSDGQSVGNMSYVAGRARFYTEDDSSIDNFVFESGWGSEADSEESSEEGVVEPHVAARRRMLEQQERERQQREQQQQQQQEQQNQRNQHN